ncbi:MAG TPA: magnesium/cobalt transporter CorA, partial [Desulfobacteria bacterium]|nr:magnesium/cobalt transporter CorA [Desulfobacteria bacterium]
RERIAKNPQLMGKGVDYILYLIVDNVIDEYFPVLDHLDDMFSVSEHKLLKSNMENDLGELFNLKRAVIGMRKILSPHREMINALIRYEGIFIKEENRVFYLDIYDHIMRMFDFLETYRDLISGSQELYLAVASNKMNEIVKTLTIIATIILPLTLISGIYGMNFKYMPELNWRYGYLWAISLMFATTGGLIYYFRKQKWF